MLANIPLNRLVMYLMVVCLLPLGYITLTFLSEKEGVNGLRNTLEQLSHVAYVKDQKQSQNRAVRQYFKDADHFYIDKHIETLSLLEVEVEQLQKITSRHPLGADEKIRRRLDFISGDGNNLVFSEGVVHSFPLFQETMETLTHPVEVNLADLKKILTSIEGIRLGDASAGPHRPQLIITECRWDKKRISDKNEVLLLNLKVLKREFL